MSSRKDLARIGAGALDASGLLPREFAEVEYRDGVVLEVRCGAFAGAVHAHRHLGGLRVMEASAMLDARGAGSCESRAWQFASVEAAESAVEDMRDRIFEAALHVLGDGGTTNFADVVAAHLEGGHLFDEVEERDQFVEFAVDHGLALSIRYEENEFQVALLRDGDGNWFTYCELVEDAAGYRDGGPGPAFEVHRDLEAGVAHVRAAANEPLGWMEYLD